MVIPITVASLSLERLHGDLTGRQVTSCRVTCSLYNGDVGLRSVESGFAYSVARS